VLAHAMPRSCHGVPDRAMAPMGGRCFAARRRVQPHDARHPHPAVMHRACAMAPMGGRRFAARRRVQPHDARRTILHSCTMHDPTPGNAVSAAGAGTASGQTSSPAQPSSQRARAVQQRPVCRAQAPNKGPQSADPGAAAVGGLGSGGGWQPSGGRLPPPSPRSCHERRGALSPSRRSTGHSTPLPSRPGHRCDGRWAAACLPAQAPVARQLRGGRHGMRMRWCRC
jgi:hypothetical protein